MITRRRNSSALVALTLLFGVSVLRAEAADKTNWWSFTLAAKPPIPALADPRLAAPNPIDAFIRAKLAEQKLVPSAEADRRTLLRRVTFDLIGLPPTPEEVTAFLNDQGTNAYEKIVDRLLGSPRHGERWARHWLDTVHFGESHGYDKDKPRLNAWPYRDYVISAFNSDKPYSRFVEEQLAADVLLPDSPESIPALGFIAAGPWDFVGHVELPITKTDGLIARYNDRDDMVMNTMSTFQSLTVHCARCHDHKFDPITQRDYYGLQAVFAGVDRADRSYDSDPAVARQRRELNQASQTLAEERKRQEAEVARLGGEELRELDRRIAAAQSGTNLNKAAFGYHSQISSKQDVAKWVQVDLGESRELDRVMVVGCHDDFNNIGAGFGFPLRYRIEVSNDAAFKEGTTIVQDEMAKDVANPGVQPQSVAICACLSEDGLPVKARYVRVTATKLAPRQNDYIFALAELSVFNVVGDNLARGAPVTALDSIEAPVRWQRKNLVDGYYLGVEKEATAGSVLAELQAKRSALRQRLVPEAMRERFAANEREAKQARDALAGLPKPKLAYCATAVFSPSGSFLPAKEPRAVHLLKRGDVKKPGEEMKATGVPAVPGASAAFQFADERDEGARRAALARWITATNNLLTRRSIVNRVWHYHFGRGLVETPNDFGHMGALPSHPELLDWLAFWFQENGESLKKLHRLIVTSAAYRQSSGVESRESRVEGQTASALDSRPSTFDSANRFLARMNRSRLDAEQFHDALLAVAGNLDLTMGGPSVQQFWFKDDHSPIYDYTRFDWTGPGANRRSIYRFIVRSVPDSFMDTLDCPDANVLAPVRNVTTTALQALATLNDTFVIRQAEQLAARIEKEGADINGQIARACELCLQRRPGLREQEKLAAHARKHGLASACRVLFNSNEFMFID